MDNLAVTRKEDSDSGEPAVQIERATLLSSSPPPSLDPPPPQPTEQGYSNPMTFPGDHQDSTSSDSGNAPYPAPNQPTTSSIQSGYPAISSNYPPTANEQSSSYSSSAPLPYQMTPAAPPTQLAPVGGGGYGGAAYDTSIGFSFGGVAPTPSYNPSLPAPYNPYQNSPHPSTGGYPPAAGGGGGGYPPGPGYPPPGGYRAPTGGNSSGYAPYPSTTQGQQGSSSSYGFNF